MAALGTCHYMGLGVEIDYKIAFNWYQKASELGNINAMIGFGHCYYEGNGVEKDIKTAFSWYKKSAENGSSEGMHYLGSCYYKGHGIEKNNTLALYWLKKSYDLGEKIAGQKLQILFADKEMFGTLIDILNEKEKIKKDNEDNVKLIEHLKLFPGDDFKDAMVDFDLLCSQN